MARAVDTVDETRSVPRRVAVGLSGWLVDLCGLWLGWAMAVVLQRAMGATTIADCWPLTLALGLVGTVAAGWRIHRTFFAARPPLPLWSRALSAAAAGLAGPAALWALSVAAFSG